jgi:hypothetical protein
MFRLKDKPAHLGGVRVYSFRITYGRPSLVIVRALQDRLTRIVALS